MFYTIPLEGLSEALVKLWERGRKGVVARDIVVKRTYLHVEVLILLYPYSAGKTCKFNKGIKTLGTREIRQVLRNTENLTGFVSTQRKSRKFYAIPRYWPQPNQSNHRYSSSGNKYFILSIGSNFCAYVHYSAVHEKCTYIVAITPFIPFKLMFKYYFCNIGLWF